MRNLTKGLVKLVAVLGLSATLNSCTDIGRQNSQISWPSTNYPYAELTIKEEKSPLGTKFKLTKIEGLEGDYSLRAKIAHDAQGTYTLTLIGENGRPIGTYNLDSQLKLLYENPNGGGGAVHLKSGTMHITVSNPFPQTVKRVVVSDQGKETAVYKR